MWKINNTTTCVGLILVCAFFYWFGRQTGIGNQEARYSKMGFPTNCRALIADNIAGYMS